MPADVSTNDRASQMAQLASLIKGIRIAMLTTVDLDGSLHSRPMATQETDGLQQELWFFTGRSSHKVAEINQDYHVNLSYADSSSNRYVSISGTARLVQDQAKARQLWNPAYKAWFPKGLDDPDLSLMKITPEAAEYWDVPSSSMVHLVGVIKAAVTGKRANPGEHEQLNLK